MQVPSIIGGRYELIGPIGHGGMGTLFKFRDPRIGGRAVAIKFLLEGLDDENIRERFKQEAHAAGGLSHENIVRIFDVGELDGQAYIVMEYVEGQTVASRLKAGTVVPLPHTLDLVEQLCDGLAHAHSRGIVHRDIKPSNLMVTLERAQMRLKILDFGIAKVSDNALTAADSILGTMNYMSPEQLRGAGGLDSRSDIFAVGSVFYEMLSQRRAFPGTVQDGLLGRIMYEAPEALSKLLPGLDPDIERIVNRALEKDPGRRYQHLAEMRRDIRHVRMRLLQDRIDLLLDSGRRAFEQRQYEGTLATCEEILALDPDHTRAVELQRKAREALDSQSTLEATQLYGEARTRLDDDAITEARNLMARASELAPGAADTTLERSVERHAAARDAARLAQDELERGNATAAKAAADEALALRPDMRAALDVRGQAETMLAGRERARDERRELDDLMQMATVALDRGELTRGESLVRRARQLAPDEPEVTRLVQRVEAAARDRQAPPPLPTAPLAGPPPAPTAATPTAAPPPMPAAAAPPPPLPVPAAPMPAVESRPEPAAGRPGAARGRLWLAAAAVAVLIVGAGLAWMLTRASSTAAPPPAAVEALGVSIDATPWARVRIRALTEGIEAPADTFTTPFNVQLQPGRYQLEMSNDTLTSQQTTEVEVAATGENRFHVTMPGFDANEAVQTFLAPPR